MTQEQQQPQPLQSKPTTNHNNNNNNNNNQHHLHHSYIAVQLIRSIIHSLKSIPSPSPSPSSTNQNNNNHHQPIIIDGQSLSIDQLILSSINNLSFNFQLTDHQPTLDRVNHSVDFLLNRTNQSTYGVTTGFGATATTRTLMVEALQVSIIEHLLIGLTGLDLRSNSIHPPNLLSQALNPNLIPESIVRAAILVRINSLLRGHSAVRIELLDGLVNLLNLSITPIVPLRGTISASGDLAPLAYIAGALCGHPDVYVIDRSSSQSKIMTSAESLKAHGIKPLILGPKEGLAIANGTSFSAATASIAIYHAHILGLLSQVLTAMTVEAMMGQIGAFHPFIHQTARPHPGQVEVAKNIYRFLRTSSLLDPNDQPGSNNFEQEKLKQILRQDRYPLRTAPQWIGPQLEDLLVAHQVIAREINCTTDNPLVDLDNGLLHHGGNFQATSIASAMEKTRLAMAAIGKIMFAQVTELNNSFMNKGLPSCLNGHEPSTNYHTKGLDTACAAYCSELQYLASPVTTHVQSAEGHNQSINSLAFISARKTLEAIELLKMLMASHLYCLCQAIDLRVFEIKFKNSLSTVFGETIQESFGTHLTPKRIERLAGQVIDRFWSRREFTASLDSIDRTRDGLEASVSVIMAAFDEEEQGIPIGSMEGFKSRSTELIVECLEELRSRGLGYDSVNYLGESRSVYRFVRTTLAVPARLGDVCEGDHGPTIGTMVDKIFRSLQIDHPICLNGLLEVLSDLFDEPHLQVQTNGFH